MTRPAATFRRLTATTAVCAGIALSGGTTAAYASPPAPVTLENAPNLLSAGLGSLESGVLGDWAPTGAGVLGIVNTPTHTGDRALSLTNATPVFTAAALSAAGRIPAVPGNKYTASFWTNARTTAANVKSAVTFFDASGTQLASVGSQVVKDVVGSWQLSPEAVAIAPAGTATVSVGAWVQVPQPGAAFLIDDISLATAPGGSPDVVGPLTTSGNKILDGNGQPVVFRGLNRSGLEGLDLAGPTKYDIGRAKAWGANMIRVPLGEHLWLQSSCKYDPTYKSRVDDVVRWITDLGMVALLDMHWNMISPCGTASQQPMADYPNAITYWQELGARYKNNPLVAFDLYNEPHHISDSVWRNGGSVTWQGVTYQAAGMQQMYDAVRSTGATNLITVSGNTWANAAPADANRLNGTNLAYAVHIYTCPTVAPPACTNTVPYNPGQILKNWVTPSQTAPVIVTEFGWPDPADGKYATAVIDYAETNGWGWLQYTWGNATWGDFSLLSTAGDGATFEPKPGGMPALAAFPGVPTPEITAPDDDSSQAGQQVQLQGVAQAGTSVTVYDGDRELDQTTANNAGSWSTSATLADGTHVLTATTVDEVGATSAHSDAVHLTVDSTAPAAPHMDPPAQTINQATLHLTGTAEADSAVLLFDSGDLLTTVPVGDAGTWAATVTLPDGQRSLSARAKDGVGNLSPSSAEAPVMVDTQAPEAPVIAEPADNSWLHVHGTDVNGTAAAGTVVRVYDGTAVIATANTDALGHWTASVSALADGTHDLGATATDVAGNLSSPAVTHKVTVDTTAPAVPQINSPVPGSIQSSQNLSVSGQAEPGSTVLVKDGTATLLTATTDGTGHWSDSATVGQGTHVLTVSATDRAGNPSSFSAPVSVVVDSLVPAAPVLTAPLSGSTDTDGVVTVAGKAEPGSLVVVRDLGTILAQPQADAQTGNWSIQVSLANGTHFLTAMSTDTAGNVSSPSASVTITVNTSSADLGVTLSKTPASVVANAPMTVTARVDNAGPTAANGATLTLAVTGSVSGISATTSPGACAVANQVVNCTLGTLPAGQRNVTVSLRPTKHGAVAMTGTVQATTTDPVPANNQATLTVPVQLGNGRIAFVSSRNGGKQIFTMNPDGSSVLQLTSGTGSATNTEPEWSPDGSRLAFTSMRDANAEIYSMLADGTGVRRLTTNSKADTTPVWSPDGNRIAFTSTRDGNAEIYAMNADGSGLKRLTNSSTNDSNPAWSPDGQRIAFATSRDKNSEIYLMNPDGSGLKRLTSTKNNNETAPAWSPNGSTIAYQSDGFGTQVSVMAADGSNVRLLTLTMGNNGDVSWSPDGSLLAFASNRQSNTDVYTMTPTGANVSRLTTLAAVDETPGWQPL